MPRDKGTRGVLGWLPRMETGGAGMRAGGAGGPLLAPSQGSWPPAEEIVQLNGGSGLAWAEEPEERGRLWAMRHSAWYAALALRPGCQVRDGDGDDGGGGASVGLEAPRLCLCPRATPRTSACPSPACPTWWWRPSGTCRTPASRVSGAAATRDGGGWGGVSWGGHHPPRLTHHPTGPMVGHIGDGNFHCLLIFDTQDPDETQRVHAFAQRLGR